MKYEAQGVSQVGTEVNVWVIGERNWRRPAAPRDVLPGGILSSEVKGSQRSLEPCLVIGSLSNRHS